MSVRIFVGKNESSVKKIVCKKVVGKKIRHFLPTFFSDKVLRLFENVF